MPNIPEVHLLDYLQVIKRRKWIVIACLFIIVTIVAIGNYTMEPIYQATAQIIIDKEQRESPVTGEMMEHESYESESLTFKTHFFLIDSFPVLKRVVETLPDRQREEVEASPLMMFKDAIIENIRKFKQFIRNLFPIEEKEAKQPIDDPSLILYYKIKALKSKINVEPVKDSRLVNINVQDNDPLYAREIANAVANAYIEYHRTSRIQAAKNSLAWFTEQLQDMKEKLRESEAKFYEFKERERIFSIKGKQDIDIQRIADINHHYAETKSKRLEVEAKIQELKNILNHGVGERIAPTIIENTVLQNLYSQLILSEVELSGLQKSLKWKHPKTLETESRIQQIKEKFDIELKKALNNLGSEYAVLKNREQSLLSTIRQYEKEALGLNKKEMQYAIREREVETNKGLHNLLLTKFKETNMIEDMDMTNIRVVEPAVTPEIPIKPRKSLNLILATIVGLTLGVGLSFFFTYMDRTIKTPEEVDQYLGLPALAVIPKEPHTSNKFITIPDQGLKSLFSEAFRSLRTNIRFSHLDKPLKTLLITSSGPTEGKTTTVANLGITMAQAGARVLVVDSDLRLPSLHKAFKVNNSSGLTDILKDAYDTDITQEIPQGFSVGDMFQLITIQEKTGILKVKGIKDQFNISFEKGEVVDINWTNRPVEKRLAALLENAGKITKEQAQEALTRQKVIPQRLGYILINLGYVEPQDLEGPLKLHLMESLNNIFSLKDADLEFEQRNVAKYDKTIFDTPKASSSILKTLPGVSEQPFIESNIFSFIKDTEIENLKVLTSGSLPPNPSEVLGSKRMQALIKVLSGKFDTIIFDSPPVTSVTDACTLASFLDGVLLMLHTGLVGRDIIQRAKQQLENVNAKILGVLLNQVDLKREGYYYRYYSYYDYGDKKEHKKKPHH